MVMIRALEKHKGDKGVAIVCVCVCVFEGGREKGKKDEEEKQAMYSTTDTFTHLKQVSPSEQLL